MTADETAAGPGQPGRRPAKSAEAFRTISEVSGELDVPQHVLRFWETKFAQVRPLKRAGGRRYYRPEDIGLLRTIRDLLYRDGYTIKGAQKLLRERNARPHAAAGAIDPDPPRAAAPPAAAAPVPAPPRARPEPVTPARNDDPAPGLPFPSDTAGDEEFTISRAELQALIDELVAIRNLLRTKSG